MPIENQKLLKELRDASYKLSNSNEYLIHMYIHFHFLVENQNSFYSQTLAMLKKIKYRLKFRSYIETYSEKLFTETDLSNTYEKILSEILIEEYMNNANISDTEFLSVLMKAISNSNDPCFLIDEISFPLSKFRKSIYRYLKSFEFRQAIDRANNILNFKALIKSSNIAQNILRKSAKEVR